MNIGQIHQMLGTMDRFISDQSSRIKNAVGEKIPGTNSTQTPKPVESPAVEKTAGSNPASVEPKVGTETAASKTNSGLAKSLNFYGRHGEMQTQKAATLGQHIDIKV